MLLMPIWFAVTLITAKVRSTSAIRDYSKAIRLKPDYANAYVARGNAYSSKDEVDRAIADYTKALELKPNYN